MLSRSWERDQREGIFNIALYYLINMKNRGKKRTGKNSENMKRVLHTLNEKQEDSLVSTSRTIQRYGERKTEAIHA